MHFGSLLWWRQEHRASHNRHGGPHHGCRHECLCITGLRIGVLLLPLLLDPCSQLFPSPQGLKQLQRSKRAIRVWIYPQEVVDPSALVVDFPTPLPHPCHIGDVMRGVEQDLKQLACDSGGLLLLDVLKEKDTTLPCRR